MTMKPPKFKRTNIPVPYPTLFRSIARQRQPHVCHQAPGIDAKRDLARFPVDERLRLGPRRPYCGQALKAHRLEASRHLEAKQVGGRARKRIRSEEHTSALQSLMRISYAVFCLT